MPKLILIAAMDQNRAIGINGELPWRLPADLKRFKALTMGQSVLMGRKTFESIGKALPGRDNLVLSHSGKFAIPAEGIRCFSTLEQAMSACKGPELWVIGGGEIYGLTLPLASRLELTHVETQVDGADAFFPEIPACFVEVASECGAENGLRYRFTSYQRAAN